MEKSHGGAFGELFTLGERFLIPRERMRIDLDFLPLLEEEYYSAEVSFQRYGVKKKQSEPLEKGCRISFGKVENQD